MRVRNEQHPSTADLEEILGIEGLIKHCDVESEPFVRDDETCLGRVDYCLETNLSGAIWVLNRPYFGESIKNSGFGQLRLPLHGSGLSGHPTFDMTP